MCAAAVTRGDITVKNVIPKHLEAISAKLIEIGCEVIEGDDEVRVVGRPKHQDTAISGFPDRYAASDGCDAGFGRGNQHDH